MPASLARELSLPAATALVVGQVIAVGIFLTPGTMIRTLASPLWLLLVWAVHGRHGDLRRALLRRARRALPASGRRLRLPARGLRSARRVPLRLEVPADHGSRASRRRWPPASRATRPTSMPLGNVGTRLVAVGAIAAFAVVHIVGVKLGVRLLTHGDGPEDRARLRVDARRAGEPGRIVVALHAVRRAPCGRRRRSLAAVAGAFVSAFFSFGGWWEVDQDRRRSARSRAHAAAGALARAGAS